MLLHASRLVVPRGGKPAIDVSAPLPEHWGEWATLLTPEVPASESVGVTGHSVAEAA